MMQFVLENIWVLGGLCIFAWGYIVGKVVGAAQNQALNNEMRAKGDTPGYPYK